MDPGHILVRESLAWINFHSCFNGWLNDPLRGFRDARDLAMTGHEALGNAQAAKEDVSYVRQNALMLTGQYLQQLLHARSSLFKDGLWLHLSAAGLPWS
ncbi:hypothetical protein LJR231_002127 [Phyllobacterium sp. LjRoot231]|uniref:hypothetical protein n=1 Tax=Phyllobacterium sp. LjRoot231 TaxID=3342289 RepID=UPI003ED075E3